MPSYEILCSVVHTLVMQEHKVLTEDDVIKEFDTDREEAQRILYEYTYQFEASELGKVFMLTFLMNGKQVMLTFLEESFKNVHDFLSRRSIDQFSITIFAVYDPSIDLPAAFKSKLFDLKPESMAIQRERILSYEREHDGFSRKYEDEKEDAFLQNRNVLKKDRCLSNLNLKSELLHRLSSGEENELTNDSSEENNNDDSEVIGKKRKLAGRTCRARTKKFKKEEVEESYLDSEQITVINRCFKAPRDQECSKENYIDKIQMAPSLEVVAHPFQVERTSLKGREEEKKEEISFVRQIKDLRISLSEMKHA